MIMVKKKINCKWQLKFCVCASFFNCSLSPTEVTNGVEKKGKKKSVGRPPGPYTRKMIQKMSEPSVLVSCISILFYHFID